MATSSVQVAANAPVARRGGRGGRGRGIVRGTGRVAAPPVGRDTCATSVAVESQALAVISLANAGFDTGRPESTIGGETTCIVCFSNPKSHAAVPCGHQCACGPCSEQMQACPYCREPVMMWMLMRVV
eukprot:4978700-Prymnesium_polylepis.1